MDKHRLFAILEYDGTDFNGFQVQKRGRTVQGVLEQALLSVTGESIRVTGAGRTDTGVHASGQAAHWDTAWKRPWPILQRALNAVLPPDVAVRSVQEVGPDFSARFSAKSRTYEYSILNRPLRSPLACRYALLVSERLDTEAMDRAAQCLVGVHDFRAFGTPPQGTKSVRDMLGARVDRLGDRVVIRLEANAFLYRMVRRMVGTLLHVGMGRIGVEELNAVLAGQRPAEPSVPPHGLCLVAVRYDLQTGIPIVEPEKVQTLGMQDEADLSE